MLNPKPTNISTVTTKFTVNIVFVNYPKVIKCKIGRNASKNLEILLDLLDIYLTDSM